MKGLISKDFLIIIKNFKLAGVVILIYALISVVNGDQSFISIFTIISSIYFLSTYSLDENAKWDSYALTMPLTREKIIAGKYLSMLLNTFLIFLISNILTIAINVSAKNENIFDGIKNNAIAFAAIIIFYSIIIPVIYKVGIVKARIYIFIICLIPVTFGTLIFKKMYPASHEKLVHFIELFMNNLYIALPLLLLVILGISYMISIQIYRKKEF